jgi:Family of unknown function (DUF5335)
MTARSLPKTEWQGYCDQISKGLRGKQAEIEILGLTFGDQKATNWLPLLGITYDPKANLVEIAMEGLDHLIHGPREIAVEDGPEGLSAMEVVGADQRRQIIKLKDSP